RARASGKFSVDQSSIKDWISVTETDAFEFVGYDELRSTAQIRVMRSRDGRNEIILDRTPFYAESGGQVADTGTVTNGKEHMRVQDVQKSPDGYIHFVDELPEQPEGEWQAMVDEERRIEVRKHHSATHLLHAALRDVLGDHVAQKGSLVDEEYLRFDFSHFEQISAEQLDRIEEIVNRKVQQNIPLQEDREVPIDEAKERGATMLFGEKYGDKVRVITFDPDYSIELCGGTHVNATGEIGYFRLMAESSAAAGVRRIEAKVGQSVAHYLRAEHHLVEQIRQELGQSDQNIAEDVREILNERKNLQKQLEELKHQQSLSALDGLFQQSTELKSGLLLVSGEIPGADMEMLKQLGYEALQKSNKKTITVMGAKEPEQGKAYVVATVTEDLISDNSLMAGQLVAKIGKKLGGGGGGQPKLATAGGRKPEKLTEVLAQVPDLINDELEESE